MACFYSDKLFQKRIPVGGEVVRVSIFLSTSTEADYIIR